MRYQTKIAAMIALVGFFLPNTSHAGLTLNPSPEYYQIECYPTTKKVLSGTECLDKFQVKKTYCNVDVCYFWGPSGDFFTMSKLGSCVDVIDVWKGDIACNALDQSLELQNENTNFESSPSSGEVVSTPGASSGETSYGNSSYGDFSYEGSSLGE